MGVLIPLPPFVPSEYSSKSLKVQKRLITIMLILLPTLREKLFQLSLKTSRNTALKFIGLSIPNTSRLYQISSHIIRLKQVTSQYLPSKSTKLAGSPFSIKLPMFSAVLRALPLMAVVAWLALWGESTTFSSS